MAVILSSILSQTITLIVLLRGELLILKFFPLKFWSEQVVLLTNFGFVETLGVKLLFRIISCRVHTDNQEVHVAHSFNGDVCFDYTRSEFES